MHYNFNLFNMSYNDDEELKIGDVGVEEEDENEDPEEDLNEPPIDDGLVDDDLLIGEFAGLDGSEY